MKKSVFLLALLLAGCGTVDVGEVGFKRSFGEVGEQLDSGLYFYNPLTTSLETMNVQQQKWTGNAQAYSRDIQTATISFAANLHLDPKYARATYISVGEEWATKSVPQVIDQAVKTEIGQWTAVDLIPNRAKVVDRITRSLRADLARRHIVLDSFDITNIDLSDEFEQAVEAKQVAVQSAIRAQNQTVEVEEKGKQTVIAAKAEAEAMAIRARALEANPKLTEYEAVQKWDGALPTYVGGTMPMITFPGNK